MKNEPCFEAGDQTGVHRKPTILQICLSLICHGVSMSFYYSARKQVISIFSSDAVYSWNHLKVNYIVQKNTKKPFTVLCRNGMMVVRRASSFAFEQSLFCKKRWQMQNTNCLRNDVIIIKVVVRGKKDGVSFQESLQSIKNLKLTFHTRLNYLLFCFSIFAFFCSSNM